MIDFQINPKAGVQIYIQIRNRIVYAISTNELTPGDRLPSVRALARQLGVAVATVRHAYAELERDGFVSAAAARGVFVRELSRATSASTGSPHVDLVEIFSGAIGQACAMGVSVKEARAAASAAFSRWQSPPSVVFVGAEVEYLDYYAPMLQEALDGTRAEIKPVLIDALRDGTSDLCLSARCVVTMVRSFSDVRKVLAETDIPIVAMAIRLSDETKKDIMSIEQDRKVVLFSEQHNLLGFKSSIDQYLAIDAPIECVESAGANLEAIARSTDVLLHSLASRKRAERIVGPRKIELHFVPDQVSLDRIRSMAAGQATGAD